MTIASLFSQEKNSAYDGNSIKELVVKGNFEVLLFQSDFEDLYIHAPVNVTRSIKSEFKNGVYSITNSRTSGMPAKLYLVVKDLKSLKATGNVTIKTPTNICLKHLDLNISEDVNATLFISSDDLCLDVKGSGYVHVSGEIDTLRLTTDHSANVSFDIKSKKVYSTIKSESEVMFEGNVFFLYSEVYQFAIIDNQNAETGTCIISTFDNSLAKIKASDFLYLHAGGKSTIAYKGNGKIEVAEKDKKATIRGDGKHKTLVSRK